MVLDGSVTVAHVPSRLAELCQHDTAAPLKDSAAYVTALQPKERTTVQVNVASLHSSSEPHDHNI